MFPSKFVARIVVDEGPEEIEVEGINVRVEERLIMSSGEGNSGSGSRDMFSVESKPFATYEEAS